MSERPITGTVWLTVHHQRNHVVDRVGLLRFNLYSETASASDLMKSCAVNNTNLDYELPNQLNRIRQRLGYAESDIHTIFPNQYFIAGNTQTTPTLHTSLEPHGDLTTEAYIYNLDKPMLVSLHSDYPGHQRMTPQFMVNLVPLPQFDRTNIVCGEVDASTYDTVRKISDLGSKGGVPYGRVFISDSGYIDYKENYWRPSSHAEIDSAIELEKIRENEENTTRIDLLQRYSNIHGESEFNLTRFLDDPEYQTRHNMTAAYIAGQRKGEWWTMNLIDQHEGIGGFDSYFPNILFDEGSLAQTLMVYGKQAWYTDQNYLDILYHANAGQDGEKIGYDHSYYKRLIQLTLPDAVASYKWPNKAQRRLGMQTPEEIYKERINKRNEEIKQKNKAKKEAEQAARLIDQNEIESPLVDKETRRKMTRGNGYFAQYIGPVWNAHKLMRKPRSKRAHIRPPRPILSQATLDHTPTEFFGLPTVESPALPIPLKEEPDPIPQITPEEAFARLCRLRPQYQELEKRFGKIQNDIIQDNEGDDDNVPLAWRLQLDYLGKDQRGRKIYFNETARRHFWYNENTRRMCPMDDMEDTKYWIFFKPPQDPISLRAQMQKEFLLHRALLHSFSPPETIGSLERYQISNLAAPEEINVKYVLDDIFPMTQRQRSRYERQKAQATPLYQRPESRIPRELEPDEVLPSMPPAELPPLNTYKQRQDDIPRLFPTGLKHGLAGAGPPPRNQKLTREDHADFALQPSIQPIEKPPPKDPSVHSWTRVVYNGEILDDEDGLDADYLLDDEEFVTHSRQDKYYRENANRDTDYGSTREYDPYNIGIMRNLDDDTWYNPFNDFASQALEWGQRGEIEDDPSYDPYELEEDYPNPIYDVNEDGPQKKPNFTHGSWDFLVHPVVEKKVMPPGVFYDDDDYLPNVPGPSRRPDVAVDQDNPSDLQAAARLLPSAYFVRLKSDTIPGANIKSYIKNDITELRDMWIESYLPSIKEVATLRVLHNSIPLDKYYYMDSGTYDTAYNYNALILDKPYNFVRTKDGSMLRPPPPPNSDDDEYGYDPYKQQYNEYGELDEDADIPASPEETAILDEFMSTVKAFFYGDSTPTPTKDDTSNKDIYKPRGTYRPPPKRFSEIFFQELEHRTIPTFNILPGGEYVFHQDDMPQPDGSPSASGGHSGYDGGYIPPEGGHSRDKSSDNYDDDIRRRSHKVKAYKLLRDDDDDDDGIQAYDNDEDPLYYNPDGTIDYTYGNDNAGSIVDDYTSMDDGRTQHVATTTNGATTDYNDYNNDEDGEPLDTVNLRPKKRRKPISLQRAIDDILGTPQYEFSALKYRYTEDHDPRRRSEHDVALWGNILVPKTHHIHNSLSELAFQPIDLHEDVNMYEYSGDAPYNVDEHGHVKVVNPIRPPVKSKEDKLNELSLKRKVRPMPKRMEKHLPGGRFDNFSLANVWVTDNHDIFYYDESTGMLYMYNDDTHEWDYYDTERDDLPELEFTSRIRDLTPQEVWLEHVDKNGMPVQDKNGNQIMVDGNRFLFIWVPGTLKDRQYLTWKGCWQRDDNALVDKKGRVYDRDMNRIQRDGYGRRVNSRGQLLDQWTRPLRRDKDGRCVTEEGWRVDKYGYVLYRNKKGMLVNRYGVKVSIDGSLLDDLGQPMFKHCKTGKYYDKYGNLLDEYGRHIALSTTEMTRHPQTGQILDAWGRPVLFSPEGHPYFMDHNDQPTYYTVTTLNNITESQTVYMTPVIEDPITKVMRRARHVLGLESDDDYKTPNGGEIYMKSSDLGYMDEDGNFRMLHGYYDKNKKFIHYNGYYDDKGEFHWGTFTRTGDFIPLKGYWDDTENRWRPGEFDENGVFHEQLGYTVGTKFYPYHGYYDDQGNFKVVGDYPDHVVPPELRDDSVVWTSQDRFLKQLERVDRHELDEYKRHLEQLAAEYGPEDPDTEIENYTNHRKFVPDYNNGRRPPPKSSSHDDDDDDGHNTQYHDSDIDGTSDGGHFIQPIRSPFSDSDAGVAIITGDLTGEEEENAQASLFAPFPTDRKDMPQWARENGFVGPFLRGDGKTIYKTPITHIEVVSPFDLFDDPIFEHHDDGQSYQLHEFTSPDRRIFYGVPAEDDPKYKELFDKRGYPTYGQHFINLYDPDGDAEAWKAATFTDLFLNGLGFTLDNLRQAFIKPENPDDEDFEYPNRPYAPTYIDKPVYEDPRYTSDHGPKGADSQRELVEDPLVLDLDPIFQAEMSKEFDFDPKKDNHFFMRHKKAPKRPGKRVKRNPITGAELIDTDDDDYYDDEDLYYDDENGELDTDVEDRYHIQNERDRLRYGLDGRMWVDAPKIDEDEDVYDANNDDDKGYDYDGQYYGYENHEQRYDDDNNNYYSLPVDDDDNDYDHHHDYDHHYDHHHDYDHDDDDDDDDYDDYDDDNDDDDGDDDDDDNGPSQYYYDEDDDQYYYYDPDDEQYHPFDPSDDDDDNDDDDNDDDHDDRDHDDGNHQYYYDEDDDDDEYYDYDPDDEEYHQFDPDDDDYDEYESRRRLV